MPPINRLLSLPRRYGCHAAILMWRSFRETKLYDILAALPVIVWFSLSIGIMISGLMRELALETPAGADLRLVVSVLARVASIAFIFLAVVLLVVRRLPRAKAAGLLPRIIAFAGTFMMISLVWLEPRPPSLALASISLTLTLSGMCFSIYSLLHLGRSFSLMPEARHLVTDGPYAFVRHPLYLGEAFSTLGLVLQYLSPLAVAIFALQLACQLQRIEYEERILASLFPEYDAYRTKTAKLVPGLY